eukprot:1838881-Pyramimonas_sp.AAC.1
MRLNKRGRKAPRVLASAVPTTLCGGGLRGFGDCERVSRSPWASLRAVSTVIWPGPCLAQRTPVRAATLCIYRCRA